MKAIQSIIIRVFDVILSLVALLVLTPLLLPVMLGLLLTGEHHIFYRQIRVGRNGKEFGLLKFSTMLENSPNMPGGLTTLKDDPRILPMGRFLRKTKINELPQLINILLGDMSVIGFRPTVPSVYENWPDWAKETLMDCKPGLSGLGSIVFRNEEEILQGIENRYEYYMANILPYKLELESWYIQHRNVALYWKLIILTIDAIFGGTGWKRIKGLPEVPEALKQCL